jgi:hypothetical protein
MGQVDINPKLYYITATYGTEILCGDLLLLVVDTRKFNNCGAI